MEVNTDDTTSVMPNRHITPVLNQGREETQPDGTLNPWVTQKDYTDFLWRFGVSLNKGAEGEFYSLRLGQAFCNHFNVWDPQIFYATKNEITGSKRRAYVREPEYNHEKNT